MNKRKILAFFVTVALTMAILATPPSDLAAQERYISGNTCVSYMRQCMSWCGAAGCFVGQMSCDPEPYCSCECY
jgi:hypothetical protein